MNSLNLTNDLRTALKKRKDEIKHLQDNFQLIPSKPNLEKVFDTFEGPYIFTDDITTINMSNKTLTNSDFIYQIEQSLT